MTIKEIRKSLDMTQQEASSYLNIPLRTYKNYENIPSKQESIKYHYIHQQMSKLNVIDEEHGILKIDAIKAACSSVFSQYKISVCYLFGSYARGQADGKSDVDLLVSTKESGMKFFGIAEKLRLALGKKVDLLDTSQLKDNVPLIDNILKEGIRIYEQPEE